MITTAEITRNKVSKKNPGPRQSLLRSGRNDNGGIKKRRILSYPAYKQTLFFYYLLSVELLFLYSSIT